MTKNPKLRALIGVVLGACAGTSFCLSVLPMVLHQAGIGGEFNIQALSRYLVPMALIWAVSGWAVTRTGFMLGGGFVLGATGLASGLVLMFAATHTGPKILAVGGVAGLVYGFLGGLLLARILEAPAPEGAQDE